jgi:aldose 1-epimerase
LDRGRRQRVRMTDVVLALGSSQVVIDARDGGRLSSLRVDSLELLADVGADPIRRGCFVMAPYAGRLRDGMLRWQGHRTALPLSLTPHAGHGLVYDRPWRVLGSTGTRATLQCQLDERWPFGGTVRQDLALHEGHLDMQVTLEALDAPFPAVIGWHPWFHRRLGRGDPAQISIRADAMLARDAAGVATDRHVSVPDPPWDDCFVDPAWPVTISWPGALRLAVEADTRYVVVYDENPDAVCVEPQTGPPDQPNTSPRIVTPARPLVARTTWRWRLA